MDWNLLEIMAYYRAQGAPGDQNALTAMLREVQERSGGAIPRWTLPRMAEGCGVKESFLLALINRLPSLRLEDTHLLELCGGPSCRRTARLAAFVERTYGQRPKNFTLRVTGCMRLCGKGPNLKWDGKLYHNAGEALIRELAGEP